MYGGQGRLLKLCSLPGPICSVLLLTCLPLSASAIGWGDPNSPSLDRCTAAITENWHDQGSLDEKEANHCVDLLVDKLAQLQIKPAAKRGKPLPPPPDYPPARYWHAFTGNGSSLAAESRLFMFGGADDGMWVAPDLWYYSESEGGCQVAGTGKSRPGPRLHLAWSCGAGQCVAAHGTWISPLQETWVYSEANASWTQINCRRRFCPSAREMATMAYDPERAYHVLFGGYNYRHSMGDTHTFADGRWTSHLPSQPPYRRDRAAAEFVALTDVKAVVMHGGLIDETESLCDMFAWNGVAWVEIESYTQAPCLHSHSMIWDEHGERLVVTGGYLDNQDNSNEAVWYFQFYSGTTGSWTSDLQSDFATCVSQADPGARMSYDRASGKVVLFGGLEGQESIVATDTLTTCDLSDAPDL
jgi:hypothetical protein